MTVKNEPIEGHYLEYSLDTGGTRLICPVDQQSVRHIGHHQWRCPSGLSQQSDESAKDHPALRYLMSWQDVSLREKVAHIRGCARIVMRGGWDELKRSYGVDPISEEVRALWLDVARSPEERELARSWPAS